MLRSDLVLSDVHVYSCPPRQKEWTTRFYFRPNFNSLFDNNKRDEEKKPIKNSDLKNIYYSIDEQGDYDVQRPPPPSFITIRHHLATTIENVALQVWNGSLLLSDYLISQYNKRHVPSGTFSSNFLARYLLICDKKTFLLIYNF